MFGAPSDSGNATSDGAVIEVPRGANLPRYCLRCGDPAERSISKTFYWHEPLLYLLIFAGLLIYAIVAVFVRKSLQLDIPFCERHWRERSKHITIGLVVGFAALPIGILVGKLPGDTVWVALIVTLVLLAGGFGVAINAAATLTPKRIDDAGGRFSGGSPAFHARLTRER